MAKLNDRCDSTGIPYGHVFSFIKKEALALCTELRIQNKY